MARHTDGRPRSAIHPSTRPAGRGITIGNPRRYGPGDDVLDAGSGPGYFARLLASAVGPSGSVTGLDAAPEMAEYASGRARGLENCSFRAGSADTVPFPDGGFDVVVSSLVLHHIPDDARVTVVREMKRVLRPQGRLLLADFSIPERGFWHAVGAITGHSRAQAKTAEPLVKEAGFADLLSGDAPPWLHYVRATNP